MPDDKALKAGDSKEFIVGDKTLLVEAVPYGNIKKILKLVSEVATVFKSDGDPMTQIGAAIEEKLPSFLPLLFRKGTVDYMTSEWIDDNVSLAQLRAIVEAAIVVNGLQDFFGKKGATQVPPVEKAAEKISSTTSSDLPMAGDPAK